MLNAHDQLPDDRLPVWRKVGGSLWGLHSGDSSRHGGFSCGPSFPRGTEEAASMQKFMVN